MLYYYIYFQAHAQRLLFWYFPAPLRARFFLFQYCHDLTDPILRYEQQEEYMNKIIKIGTGISLALALSACWGPGPDGMGRGGHHGHHGGGQGGPGGYSQGGGRGGGPGGNMGGMGNGGPGGRM